MNCFPEFTYSVYADGELPVEEARDVEAHLAECPSCRVMLEGLRLENRMIGEVLAEAREERETLPEWQPASPSRLIFGALAALAGVILGLRSVVVGVANWGISEYGIFEPFSGALDWLNPAGWTARISLLFSGVFYFMDEGASMLLWGVTAIGSLALLLLLISSSLFLSRRRPAGLGSMAFLMLAAILGFTPRAAAVETHRGQTAYTLPAGKTINDTLMIGGDNVTIDGDVTGNLFVACRRFILRGNVKGDVFAATQSTEIEGNITGNLVSANQWMNLNGKVGGSVQNWSQDFRMAKSAVVTDDLIAFSANSDINGEVGRDIMVFASVIYINGKTGRNVDVRGDRLTVSSSARIGGDLHAKLRRVDRASIETGAVVSGKQAIEQATRSAAESRYLRGRFYFWQFIQWLAALLTGTLLVILFPNFYHGTVQAVGFTWGPLLRSLGIGFAVLCAGPIAMLLLCITLIGIPVAVLALMGYLAGLYLAKIFLAALIGHALLQKAPQTRQDTLLALLVGLLVFFVAVNLPYAVGGVLYFIALCIGLGAFTYRLASSLQSSDEVRA